MGTVRAVMSFLSPLTSARLAVGYVRVSTDMQANDGLSLDAQRHAIESYCASQGQRLVKIYHDIESGEKRIARDWRMRWRQVPMSSLC